jgi:hypothetical protein
MRPSARQIRRQLCRGARSPDLCQTKQSRNRIRNNSIHDFLPVIKSKYEGTEKPDNSFARKHAARGSNDSSGAVSFAARAHKASSVGSDRRPFFGYWLFLASEHRWRTLSVATGFFRLLHWQKSRRKSNELGVCVAWARIEREALCLRVSSKVA